MKVWLPLFLFVIMTSSLAGEQDFMGWRVCDFKDKSYRFKITKSAVAKAPKWEQQQREPPLAPRAAYAAALRQAKKLRPEVTNWNVASISLTPLGVSDETFLNEQWIYMVTLQDYSGPISGIPHAMSIPVLLNGATIQPEIKGRK